MWSPSLIVVAFLIVGCSSQESSAQSHSPPRVGSSGEAPIPDAKPEGVRLGPIVLDGRDLLGDLGLRVEIYHPSPADVGMWLCYDENDDGVDDVRIPIELHLGKRRGWDEPEPYACPQELDGDFYFGGSEEDGSLLAPLRDLMGGGAFSLVVVDSLAADTGVVRTWSLHRRSSRNANTEGREVGQS